MPSRSPPGGLEFKEDRYSFIRHLSVLPEEGVAAFLPRRFQIVGDLNVFHVSFRLSGVKGHRRYEPGLDYRHLLYCLVGNEDS